MGYHTEFEGQFNLDRPLTPEHKAYLERFARTRHMLWDESKLPSLPDPVREAAKLPLGLFGIYFTGIEDYSISLTRYSLNGRPAYHPALINYNLTPAGVPGLWCQWAPNEQGTAIEWDGTEKFYDYIEWLQFLIKHFIGPWGYTLNGSVTWQGANPADRGIIEVKTNDLIVTEEEVSEEDESDEGDEEAEGEPIGQNRQRDLIYAIEDRVRRAINELAPIFKDDTLSRVETELEEAMEAILDLREMLGGEE